MHQQIKIGIADDHLILRQGLIAILKEYSHLNIIIDVNNGQELMLELEKQIPDIILLDIEMPVMNGREVLEKVQQKYPNIKVIIMSMYFNDSYIIEFIKNGACAFLPKNCDVDTLIDAINTVYERGHFYDEKVSEAIVRLLKQIPKIEKIIPKAEFTNRELEIIEMICLKKTNLEIAETLHLSVRTIEGHRYNISKKTNTSNTLELVEFVIKNNILKNPNLFLS
jgi:DNA-binding NarL/FixJ family response regulator